MKRFAIMTDTHLASRNIDSQSLFPLQMAKLPPNTAQALYDKLREGITNANDAVYEYLFEKRETWEALIHLGDVTGGWQEAGMGENNLITLAQDYTNRWRAMVAEIRFCLGGHDVGYSHRGSLPHGGINYHSIELCQETFGDLWWLKECEGVCLLGICSPIAAYDKSGERICQLRQKQECFLLSEPVQNQLATKPWILFAHDPFLPGIVKAILHDSSHNCRAFIHGHRHDPKFTKLFRALGWLCNDPFLRVSHTCPSVAPLWWPGCGWMEVIIENGKVAIKNHQVPLPQSIAKLPTASFLRCLRWMLRP